MGLVCWPVAAWHSEAKGFMSKLPLLHAVAVAAWVGVEQMRGGAAAAADSPGVVFLAYCRDGSLGAYR